jgi:ketosteroid isomerase-like protein
MRCIAEASFWSRRRFVTARFHRAWFIPRNIDAAIVVNAPIFVGGPLRAEAKTRRASIMSTLSDDATTFYGSDGSPLPDSALSAAQKIVQRWFQTALAKDKPGTMALFTDDSVVEIPFNESGRTEEGAFRRYSGLSELEGFTDASHAAEGTMGAWDIEVSQIEGGETIFVESRGNIVMSSGREYRNRYVFRFDLDLDRGTIRRLREYYNPVTSGLAFGRTIGQ